MVLGQILLCDRSETLVLEDVILLLSGSEAIFTLASLDAYTREIRVGNFWFR